MDIFQVIQPLAILTPYIKQYWFLSMRNIMQDRQRIVPTGCITLSFIRKGQIYTCSGKNSSLVLRTSDEPVCYISGQFTTYTDLLYTGTECLVVVFQPSGATAILGNSLQELSNCMIRIDEWGDATLTELAKRLAEQKDIRSGIPYLEMFMLKRLFDFENLNYKRISSVLPQIQAGQTNLSALAQSVCLSYKQFKRIFSEITGVNPKDYLRITRFQKALNLLQQKPGTLLNQLASDCGYYDKSHFIREFKEFMAYTPKEFLSVCDEYSECHTLFRSAMIDPLDRLKQQYSNSNNIF